MLFLHFGDINIIVIFLNRLSGDFTDIRLGDLEVKFRLRGERERLFFLIGERERLVLDLGERRFFEEASKIFGERFDLTTIYYLKMNYLYIIYLHDYQTLYQ